MINPKLQLLFTGKNEDEIDVIYAAYAAYITGKKDYRHISIRNAVDMLNSVVIIDWDKAERIMGLVKDSVSTACDMGDTDVSQFSINNPVDAFGINPDFISLLSLCVDNSETFMEAYKLFRLNF